MDLEKECGGMSQQHSPASGQASRPGQFNQPDRKTRPGSTTGDSRPIPLIPSLWPSSRRMRRSTGLNASSSEVKQGVRVVSIRNTVTREPVRRASSFERARHGLGLKHRGAARHGAGVESKRELARRLVILIQTLSIPVQEPREHGRAVRWGQKERGCQGRKRQKDRGSFHTTLRTAV